MIQTTTFLGIDIAKATFDVTLLVDGQRREGHFTNDADGFEQLYDWLKNHRAPHTHACMEATGRYGEALAGFLYHAGHAVSVVNPAQIKAYGQSKLQRNKTDRQDARLIADFCHTQSPALWQPMNPERLELREMTRRLEDLERMQTQETNRSKAGQTSAYVLADLKASLADLEQRIKTIKKAIAAHLKAHPDLAHAARLLRTIPGCGALTTARMLAEIGDFRAFDNAKQLAAFIGLSPVEYRSGSSIHGRARISKKGNASLRGSLYWPAITAMRKNPVVARLVARLKAAGKPSMVIIVAAMRKLVCLAYGVLKSNRPFDPAIPLAASLPS